jgi:hypothetical protein
MAVTREARAPQPRPIVRASAKCRGNTHKIRPTRRNTEGFVVARRAPFLGVRRVPLAGRNGLLATFRPPRPAVWARFKTMNSVHLFSIFERHASLLMMRRIYNLQPYLAAHRLPPPEPFGELRPAPSGLGSVDRDRERLSLAYEDNQTLASGHAGVDQVPLKHGVVLRRDRDHHRWVF